MVVSFQLIFEVVEGDSFATVVLLTQVLILVLTFFPLIFVY